ncbi:MAG: 23S rRNA (adenine(2030)-N(6))-methyltransferase RlmJ [Beijerinckiaceae bacterium]|nr:MAG: 23S rRNA (adenine(2030)-N(6))-methyltransferase RlmJ [Beijerinckiaceae bacterium]
MNYRHAYHAGNFADVFKHVILTRILAYLARKPAAFRMIDTHAGEGFYALGGVEAEKTGEWREGIARLIDARAQISAQVQELIAPYLAIAAPCLAETSPRYPGSPAIAAALLRQQDRMIFCEAHPETAARLKHNLGRDRRAKVIEIDGFIGLGAYVPPIERRGLVLIDPPFEAKDEFSRIVKHLEGAVRKWPTGSYMVWFPIKEREGVTRFYRQIGDVLVAAGIKDGLCVEFRVDEINPNLPLAGNGLVLVNPPYVLEAEARTILPWLVKVLGVPGCAGHHIARI